MKETTRKSPFGMVLFAAIAVTTIVLLLAVVPRPEIQIRNTEYAEFSLETLDEAEMASGIAPEIRQMLVPDAGVDVEHLFEGEKAKVLSRLRAVAAVATNTGSPSNCYHRPGDESHSEAVVLKWTTEAYKGTKHWYDGSLFLYNLVNPTRSTMMPNTAGINSVPPAFSEISLDDPRCLQAGNYFAQFVQSVINRIGGNWPPMLQ